MPKNPPVITTEEFISILKSSSKIEDCKEVGLTIVFLLVGTSRIDRRLIIFRKDLPSVDFEIATGHCIRLGVHDKLLCWYEINSNWKDGGYFVR